MIKVGGIWVSPVEVESVLVEHPDVREAAVVGARTEQGLETAVAFVVARAGRTLNAAALESHCRSMMAAFKRPREMIFVEELPRNANGKVQRYLLKKQLAARVLT
jgi:acyl-coenzyme A synthetase/AMP-(fatty) acid ligase